MLSTALIESTRSALYRSDDGGKNREERDRSTTGWSGGLSTRQSIVDPKNENKGVQARPHSDHERGRWQKFQRIGGAHTAIFTMCG